ncbi:(d)CMP kinase [Paracoccus sp. Z330]|uniref:Cytidylate kinase n=1 Tax=Paracoccus onchidii TaxID=3017813 RepID=A0ABT4Z9Y7_9RHOB|nr:(d)CMP kinase [Paracoccus onchidii]MDB6176156.1 (d)CMP kinase [Paracoccus onchidii]
MPFVVAIDGPAASGKGTIARAIAAHFGFHHLDTGLLYRATGVKGGDPVTAARGLMPDDLSRPDLRSAEAGQAASRIAAIADVRAALVDFQHRFAARNPGAVLDGRDIGTVICPQAQVKLYVVASDEVRAVRRARELNCDPADMLVQLQERDRRDSERAAAPMRPADDAVVIDTSDMSIDDAVATAIAAVDKARR